MEEEDFFNIKKVEAGWWRSAQVCEKADLSAGAVTRTDLEVSNKGREAFILHGVLSPAECRHLVERTEREGYEPMREFTAASRSNTRLMIDDRELADAIWPRVEGLVPAVVIKSGQTWNVVGLNHRWRFCRHGRRLTLTYTPGQHCEPHVDAAYKPSSSERSLFTFMLYLNEGFAGGATVFLQGERHTVTPHTGMALVFENNIVHEGERLASDVKYIMQEGLNSFVV